MNRPEAKNAMSKKFLNLVSITPVTFTLLIWDDKSFNLGFTQMLKTLVYNDQGWWQRVKKVHKNETASQIVLRSGGRFSKDPIINGSGIKLSPFTLRTEVSIVLHLS